MLTVSFAAVIALAATTPRTVRAESGTERLPLVELFTSEGCSSCPPADAFVSRLGGGGGVVALACHVTYWDYIGWQDAFALTACDARQKEVLARTPRGGLYTPQILLDGRDLGARRGGLEAALAQARREPASFHVALALTWDPVARTLAGEATARPQEGGATPSSGEPRLLQVAVYERHLETAVGAGENRGRSLRHDFVVRALPPSAAFSGEPGGGGVVRFRLEVPAGWKPHDLGATAFVQGRDSGRVLQAVRVDLGTGPGPPSGD